MNPAQKVEFALRVFVAALMVVYAFKLSEGGH